MHKALHRHCFDDSTRSLVSSVAFTELGGGKGKGQPCGQSTKEQPLAFFGGTFHIRHRLPCSWSIRVRDAGSLVFQWCCASCVLSVVHCPKTQTRSIKSWFLFSRTRETLSPNSIARYMPWIAETSPRLARKNLIITLRLGAVSVTFPPSPSPSPPAELYASGRIQKYLLHYCYSPTTAAKATACIPSSYIN